MAPASIAMIALCMEGTFDDRELTFGMAWRADRERKSGARFGTPRHEAADDDIKERREEQTKERDAEHAREHGYAHDVAHLGAGAACHHERHDPHHQGE